jgi:hypothetical protein
VVDLCPVGSLLSKDFLHKARAWDLDKTASVCPGCTQGCNITIDTRDDVVVRLRPRPNLEVNPHFMCDYGRMNYRWLNRGDRVEAPLIREGGRHVATDWDSALARLDQAVRGATGSAVILASGRASVESLGLVRRLVERPRVTAAIQVPLGDEAPLAGVPNLALRRERVPNLAGAELLGYGTAWEGGHAGGAERRSGRGARRRSLTGRRGRPGRGPRRGGRAGHRRLRGIRNATLVLPVTTWRRRNGTYVNRDLRAQRYNQARSQPGWLDPPGGWRRGARGPGPDADAPATAAQALPCWRDLGRLRGLTYADLGLHRSRLKPHAPRGARGDARDEGFVLLSVIKLLFVFTVVMVGVALLTLMERKVSAWMQNRWAPTGRAGRAAPARGRRAQEHSEGGDFPCGSEPGALHDRAGARVHSCADALGGDSVCRAPSHQFRRLRARSGCVFRARDPGRGSTVGTIVSGAFHAVFGVMAHHGPMPMVVADVPVGFLFVLAIGSLGVYGIALAGWASNSKYSLLGGLRAAAQLVSYEVALGLSLIPVLLLTGDVSFSRIVAFQQAGVWFVLPLFRLVLRLSGLGIRRDQPAAVRSSGSGVGADRGIPHRVQRDEVSFFFIAEYANVGDDLSDADDAVLRRLGHSVHHVGSARRRASDAAHRTFLLRQADVLDFLRNVDSLDLARVPL